jgi:hypothetical protein
MRTRNAVAGDAGRTSSGLGRADPSGTGFRIDQERHRRHPELLTLVLLSGPSIALCPVPYLLRIVILADGPSLALRNDEHRVTDH